MSRKMVKEKGLTYFLAFPAIFKIKQAGQLLGYSKLAEAENYIASI